MALVTVDDYIGAARIQLQDTRLPYRWTEDRYYIALNAAISEAGRLRPDFWLSGTIPQYETGDQVIDVNVMYRLPIVFYVVGWLQTSDMEDTNDQRAISFLSRFSASLTGGGA